MIRFCRFWFFCPTCEIKSLQKFYVVVICKIINQILNYWDIFFIYLQMVSFTILVLRQAVQVLIFLQSILDNTQHILPISWMLIWKEDSFSYISKVIRWWAFLWLISITFPCWGLHMIRKKPWFNLICNRLLWLQHLSLLATDWRYL